MCLIRSATRSCGPCAAVATAAEASGGSIAGHRSRGRAPPILGLIIYSCRLQRAFLGADALARSALRFFVFLLLLAG
eukprot:4393987-Alexandrium_andersonii.AAC.1